MTERNCANPHCRALIAACMGFTFSCDFLSGRNPPRELCAKCGALAAMDNDMLTPEGHAKRGQVLQCMIL